MSGKTKRLNSLVPEEVLSFERSSVLTALVLTRDEHCILVGDCDENSQSVHLCHVEEGVKIQAISNIPGPMGIAVMEQGAVFMSSCKEHALYSLNEEEMLEDTDALITLTRLSGDNSGHRDGVESRWNMPSCFIHEQEALERTGKRNTNGPDMTIPRTTRQSFPNCVRLSDGDRSGPTSQQHLF
ncbi:hypothetical protein OS493_027261 [Desmophyllum pertusum]|uniref:Uncharacterized protein n=1 Tax=Desmophyllum pertusum TaxID=174260 RepID=A0A9X0CY41_9CNID|nr:hypothetical protein OS493_027261 [Desmophyllum pertusum]